MWKVVFVCLLLKQISGSEPAAPDSDSSYTYYAYPTDDYYVSPGGSGSGDYTSDDEDDYIVPIGTGENFDDIAIEENNEEVKNSVEDSELFSCDNKEVFLTIDKRCDGVRDCFDCSDEIGCQSTEDRFFYCYERGNNSSAANSNFNLSDPFCIPRTKFCDGELDCASGLDEKRAGFGFKCTIKNKYRLCILPDDMICDSVVDCEDESDNCNENQRGSVEVTTFKSTKKFPKQTFQCLNVNNNVSVFQSQVCDGVIDCPDFSDECLCVEPHSESMRLFCDNVCFPSYYKERQPSQSCLQCTPGQLHLCSTTNTEFNKVSEEMEGLLNDSLCSCVDPSDFCTSGLHGLTALQLAVCVSSDEQKQTLVECLSIDGSFNTVMARMCDDRPECFFGEDECVSECFHGQANATQKETKHFCDIFIDDYGFGCGNQTEPGSPSDSGIIPCNGVFDCINRIDEKFCPTRTPCQTGSGDTNKTALSAKTFDIKQLCDGITNCPNNEDENPMTCSHVKQERCQHSTTCDYSSQSCRSISNLPEGHSYIGTSGVPRDNNVAANIALQISLLILSAFGCFGNFLGIIVVFLNSVTILRTQKQSSLKYFVRYVQESAFLLSLSVAKTLFCVYIAVIMLYKTEEILCTQSGLWRIGTFCNVLGSLAFVSANTSWVVLLVWGTLETIALFRYGTKERGENRDDFLPGENQRRPTASRSFVLAWVFSSFAFLALIWLPMIIVVVWANNYFTYDALVHLTGASNILQSDVIDDDHAMILSEKVITISGLTPPLEETFSWNQMKFLMDIYAPSLGFNMSGVIGYSSHTAACLPWLLAQPLNATSDGKASRFSTIFMIINCVLCVFSLSVCAVGLCRKRQVRKSVSRRKIIERSMICSVSGFAFLEAIAWIPILLSYFMNLRWPNTISDYVYQYIVLFSLAINCCVVAVFLQLGKDRIKLFNCWSKKGSERNEFTGETATMLNGNRN